MSDLGYALVGDLGRFEITKMYLKNGLVWMIAGSSDVPRFEGGSVMVRFCSPEGMIAGIVGSVPLPPWDLGTVPGTAWIEFSVSLESRLPGEPYMEVAR